MSSLHYRPDIDGLRALAVLFVILFHISPGLMPGGYVGVDVFFVISGFLITQLIVRNLESGRFSILEFYGRRVRRIAPALLIVMAATVITAYLFLLPEDFKKTAKAGIWSLASLANVHFWLHEDTSYFAPNARELPFLHLWSLGVEEQFYLLWPLILVLTYRTKYFVHVALVIAALSFVAGELLYAKSPSFVYYMLPTRAGELLTGAVAAVWALRGIRLPAGSAVLGIALVGATGVLLTDHSPFPGIRAIPLTLGVALIILADRNAISRILSAKPIVWVGLVSYSAYLWHWPLLAFYRYGYGDPGLIAGFVIFTITFLLAWVTYRWIEIPGRSAGLRPTETFVRQYLAPSLALFLLTVGLVRAEHPFAETRAALREQARPPFVSDSVCQRQRLAPADVVDERCVIGEGPKALLWGDSNAAHYVGMVGAFAQASGFELRNIEIDACPPLLGNIEDFALPRRRADCEASLDLVRAAVERADAIILSASYSSYLKVAPGFLDAFFDTVRMLSKTKLVILIAKAPVIQGYDRRCAEKAVVFPWLNCTLSGSPQPQIASVNARLREFAEKTANVAFFDPTHYLCPGRVCSAWENGRPRYFDATHLTLDASWDLGRSIIERDGVPAAFRSIKALNPSGA
jgi:peptidoglycan/LPS O-acetylase OafA/YrhL